MGIKRTIGLLAFTLLATAALAIPAHPGTQKVEQPDGSSVTLRLVGDEYLHFHTTDDGYSVVKDQRGYYVYAQLTDDGQLAPTDLTAHDTTVRSAQERAYLQGIQKYLAPQMPARIAEQRQNDRAARAARLQRRRAEQDSQENFRGLILLIEYNDCSFQYDNYRDLMDEMANQKNYRGNSITNVSSTAGVCVGSVRDYYTDSSNGLFVPEFDVVGPIKIDRSQYFYNGDRISDKWNNSHYLMADAINAADEEVDFSKYDSDGNGEVDMVYFIFAGLGSNVNGNDDRLLWPHASQLIDPYSSTTYNSRLRKDGKALGRYACSTELFGSEKWSTLSGIGTICHEFGHVLGLPDFYDTDNEKSGGLSQHPGEWTVMAGGGYLNYGRAPATYTLLERFALGWATPQTISAEGSYTLESIDKCNTGYHIETLVRDEYFLLENRQQTKWNAYLPGHGMLVFRVDLTNSTVWQTNTVNARPDHNYFELIRAGGWQNANEKGSDPFPGSFNVTMLNNTTTPANLLSWTGAETRLALENIAESAEGIITFDVVDTYVLQSVALPASVVMGKGTSRPIVETRVPDYCPYILQWSSDNEEVVTITSTGMATAISEGTATITVTARSPQQSEDEAVSATCQIIVEAQTVASDIAAFKQLGEDTEAALVLNDAQVLFNDKGTLYVRDGSGAIRITGIGSSWQADNMLCGTLYGVYQTNNRIPLFVANEKTDESAVRVTVGTAAAPLSKRVTEITEADYANKLTLTQVMLKNIEGYTGIFAVEGDHKVRLYNNFGLKLNSPRNFINKRFNATGILVTRELNGELIDELSLLDNITEVPALWYALNYDISEGGHVKLNQATLLTGRGMYSLPSGENTELVIESDENYAIESIVIDNYSPPIWDINVLNIQNNGDHALTVSFKLAKEMGIEHITTQASLPDSTPVTVYSACGIVVARTTIGALPQLHLQSGVYTVKTAQQSFKFLRR